MGLGAPLRLHLPVVTLTLMSCQIGSWHPGSSHTTTLDYSEANVALTGLSPKAVSSPGLGHAEVAATGSHVALRSSSNDGIQITPYLLRSSSCLCSLSGSLLESTFKATVTPALLVRGASAPESLTLSMRG